MFFNLYSQDTSKCVPYNHSISDFLKNYNPGASNKHYNSVIIISFLSLFLEHATLIFVI